LRALFGHRQLAMGLRRSCAEDRRGVVGADHELRHQELEWELLHHFVDAVTRLVDRASGHGLHGQDLEGHRP
jgi:hypothetical protein